MPRNGMDTGSKPTVMSDALARFCQRSYPAVDYIALACLAGIWVMIQLFVDPFHRMFSLDNRSIQYPFAVVERVPVVWSIIYAGVVPLLILVCWAAIFRPKPYQVQVTILGLLVALMLTSLITDIIKNAVGRPRPDLISRCMPKKGTPANTLVAWTVCTQSNNHILQEGWRSFPSGHSSFAFGGLGYLSMFLSGQMHVFRPRADLWRCILALIPMLCALMIAISRLEDYRHDVYDVTCGSILGLIIAHFSYRRYYPPLRSVACDVPHEAYEIVGPNGFSKLPGDEEQQIQERGLGSRGWEAQTYQLEDLPSHHDRLHYTSSATPA
ncbi:hypothetical protein V6000_007067 [Aspergillus fumigatus]